MARHRWIRLTFPLLYLALGGVQLAMAFAGPHIDVLHLVSAAGFLDVAAVFTYMARHGLRKAGKKIDHLQRQLQYRFGPGQDAASG